MMRKTMLLSAAALCLTVGAAVAQPPAEQPGGGTGSIGFQSVAAARDKAGKKVEPPTLNLKSEEGAVWPMVATIIFLIACGVVAIIPPKRGHQD
jgi:hypothetical protein